MRYINRDDIVSVIQERLMYESVALVTDKELEDNEVLADIEGKVIDLAISYIARRYNHVDIFADTPIRNGVLVHIIASITVYRAVRRNAARKVPEDLAELYSDAIKSLEKIQKGSMDLIDCPLLTKDDGTPISPVYGNNTKNDFFI
jgi:phage gp36-like protein